MSSSFPPPRAETLPAQAAADMEAAVHRVQEIVNQPVASLPITGGADPAMFQPGWFHPGALVPDFDHVDVRTSRECAMYARYAYITSDISPGLMFAGSDVEFNAATKFFYTDRTRPKKKLTDSEMVEINELYRTIGKCLKVLKDAKAQEKPGGTPGSTDPVLGIMAPLVDPAKSPAAPESPAPGEVSVLQAPQFRLALAGVGVLLVLLLLAVRARNRE